MKPLNVLFVTVDSLRADYTCCVGNPPVETPNIDQLAANGVTFTNAFAQGPFTTFSMPSLFTARYPSGLDYTSFGDGSVVGVSINDERTFVEVLNEAGYATAGIHSNPLLSNLFNFNRGFDHFDADLPFADSNVSSRYKLLFNKIRRVFRKHAYLPAETVTDRAVSWVEGRNDERPFFLWTHYMDVHGPYQSKRGLNYYSKMKAERLWRKAVHHSDSLTDEEASTLEEAYREEIRYTDRHIGRLLDGVNDVTTGPTLAVLTADHGDGFGEHDFYGHPHELYEELIHVPLIIRFPPSIDAGQAVESPVELLDVAPTILDVADLDLPETFEGGSLVSNDAMAEESESKAISEAEITPPYVGAVRTENWKYIAHGVNDVEYLFDLHGDSSEHRDVSDERTEILVNLRETLVDHRQRDAAKQQPKHARSGEIEDEQVQDRLKKLGYLE